MKQPQLCVSERHQVQGPTPRGIAAPRLPQIELTAAIDRLGGNPKVYRDVFPLLRNDAASLIAVATTLLADGLRREAALMFRTLRSIGDAMGASALGRAASEAEAVMTFRPSAEDGRVVGQVSLALITCSIQLEGALRTLDCAEADGRNDRPPYARS